MDILIRVGLSGLQGVTFGNYMHTLFVFMGQVGRAECKFMGICCSLRGHTSTEEHYRYCGCKWHHDTPCYARLSIHGCIYMFHDVHGCVVLGLFLPACVHACVYVVCFLCVTLLS